VLSKSFLAQSLHFLEVLDQLVAFGERLHCGRDCGWVSA
jgi:hypothetical protein